MIDRLNAALEGRYRIERQLGQGGMATVYLADDLRHDRKVALKVLKPELAAVVGADRFLAEIKTTAQLQHPHILPLHDSGEADSFLYYVMPYVEGESLRDKLDREKQLPVEEAVGITVKVAGALQAAHDRGVVHRDVKPANILLGERGEPRVADFGIALALQEAGGGRLTETGLSLGTPYYMSPEQATADRDPDPRSDIYSLACVLYEMLVGDPPHSASTAQAVIAKILSRDARPVRESRRSVPGHVDAAIGRALQRLPADRFSRAADFAAALEGRIEVSNVSRVGGAGRARRAAPGVGAGATRWVWPAIAAVAALAAVWGWLARAPEPPLVPPSHLAVPLPNLGGAATASFHQLALTPDGSTLLYTAIAPDGQNRTMRRRLDETTSSVVPGVRPFVSDYRVSPDGSAFVGRLPPRGSLYRYAIEGGGEQPLPVTTVDGPWFTWGEDGEVWASTGIGNQGMVRVDASGETSMPFGDRFSDLVIQQVLPDGATALAVRAVRGVSSGPVVLIDLEDGTGEDLMATGVAEVRFTAGFLVYALPDGRLEAVAFDPAKGAIMGDAVEIARAVAVDQGVAQFSVSATGTVAYMPEEPRSLVLVDRDGRSRPATTENRNFHAPAFSPDGERIAVDFSTEDGRNVWVLDVEDGVPTRASFDPNGHDPRWLPDGESVAFVADAAGGDGLAVLSTRPGRFSSDTVLASPAVNWTGDWLSDGSAIVTTASGADSDAQGDIVLVRDGGAGAVEPLVVTRFDEGWPAVSPDDRWLAFTSNQSGEYEVYVRPLMGGGNQIQVSRNGGREPVWGPDGRELFYRTGAGPGSELVAAAIRTEPELTVAGRAVLFSVAGIATGVPHPNYDIAPDGQTFVMVRFNPSSRIMVIQNLPEYVRRRGGGVR